MGKKQQAMKITLKGLALIAAIETGLLPEIERDGVVGYDEELFGRFWTKYTTLAQEQRQDPFGSKRKDRT